MRGLEDRRLLDEVIISRAGGECKAILLIVWNGRARGEGVGPRLCCPQEKPLECAQGLFGCGPLLNRIARLHAPLPGAESPFTKVRGDPQPLPSPPKR